MSELIDTTEMYLRTIFELEEEGIPALRARIAERLGHSGPTVSQTVSRMSRDGLVQILGDRHLELTESGRAKAMRVMRKHRLAERLLLDVIGLEWEFVHEEACRWEHVMSDRVERKLLQMLAPDGALQSPYGNPIPGLVELDGRLAPDEDFRTGVVSLPQAVSGATAPVKVVVRRLGETLQTDHDLLGRLDHAGVRPGLPVQAEQAEGGYRLASEHQSVMLDAEAAAHVFVSAQPA